jgi:hypothetical protein
MVLLCHFSHTLSPLLLFFRWGFEPGLSSDYDPPTSSSQVTGTTVLYHYAQLVSEIGSHQLCLGWPQTTILLPLSLE